MYEIGKTFKWDAAHQLHGLPEGHKCGRLHGHTYEATLHLASEELDEHGFVLDYGELSGFKRWVDDTLDHRNLNDVVPMGMPTTAEAMAEWIYRVWQPEVPALVAVTVRETGSTYATWRP